jgi:hypothetical protein
VSKFKKFLEFGYTISLHRAEHAPENGFGYGDGTEDNGCAPCLNLGIEKIIEQAEAWEQTMGRTYIVSKILDEDTSKVVTRESLQAELTPAPAMVAVPSEFYRWSHAKLVGFTLKSDGAQLPGMITLNLADVERSIESELKRYATDYTWAEKEGDKTVLRSGPWAVVDNDVVATALRTAVAAL